MISRIEEQTSDFRDKIIHSFPTATHPSRFSLAASRRISMIVR